MNKNIGIILGGVALIILIVFFLFDSSKRDMIIGNWHLDSSDEYIEFHDNNDVTSPDFEDAIWTLSDDEEIIEIHFISDELRESMLLELVSISEQKLCFINRGWDDVYDFEIDDNMSRNLTDKELDKMRTTCLYKED
tara:strand:+ start:97 stop:507 length:411 start_codon:yes stop_codon:yes gene_type:complete